MKVSDTILTLKAQSNFERTQTGRSVSKKAIDVIDAIEALYDKQKIFDLVLIRGLKCFVNFAYNKF